MAGDLEEAERQFETALRRGPEMVTPVVAKQLGKVKYELGKYDDAERLFRQALDSRLEIVECEAANNLAAMLERRGKLREARDLYRQAFRAPYRSKEMEKLIEENLRRLDQMLGGGQ